MLMSNLAGTVLGVPSRREHYAFSPYGFGTLPTQALIGFNGECMDRLTHGYALGAGHRVFLPALMRFASPDRLSPFGQGGLNAYGYCVGDPVNHTDPSGRVPFSLINSIKRLLGLQNALKAQPDLRLKAYTYDPITNTAQSQRIKMVGTEVMSLEERVPVSQISGRFYVSADRSVYLDPLLSKDGGGMPLEFYDHELTKAGFKMREVNPTHVDITNSSQPYAPGTLLISETEGLRKISNPKSKLETPGLVAAIRSGRPGVN